MKALGNLLIKAGKAIGGKAVFPIAEVAIAATAGVVVGIIGYHIAPAARTAVSAPAPAESAAEVAHEPASQADRG